MKYKDVKEGEWEYPKRRGYKLACCDCGLVHTVNFDLIKKGKRNFIVMQVFRNERSTAQIRRHMKKASG